MKTYALKLTPAQAWVLREAIGEAIDSCTHQLAMGCTDEEHDEWTESRESFTALEEQIMERLTEIAREGQPPAPIETIQRRDV